MINNYKSTKKVGHGRIDEGLLLCFYYQIPDTRIRSSLGMNLRSLRKEFGTCPSAVHGACRSAVSACAETTSLCPVFLLTLTLRTAFACRAQGCEHAADDVAARTPLPALAVSSTLHLRRFTAGNLRCAADCRRSVLRFAPYRSSIVAAGWTVRHSVALLKVSGMAVCSRRHPTASARS